MKPHRKARFVAAPPVPAAPRPAPPPAASASALSTPAPLRREHWTPAKQRIFLAALVDGGSVARAAAAAGMSRSSAHRLRARLAGTPFDRLWEHALALHTRRLADPFAPDPTAVAPPRVAPGHTPPGASQVRS